MLLVTFSGLDGSGKTTHVLRTARYLQQQGHRVRIVATAHISAGGLATFVRHVLRTRNQPHHPSSQHRDTPDLLAETETAPKQTNRDRGRIITRVTGWLVYPLDSLLLRLWLLLLSALGYTAVVCDRFVYDQIVNLPDTDGPLSRLIRRLSPSPDMAILLDVPPDVARQRRPEHPPDYYTTRHVRYRQLLVTESALTAIPSTTIDTTQQRIEHAINSAHSPSAVPAIVH